MTKKELRDANKELKRLKAIIKANGDGEGFGVSENTKNTKEFGVRYVFISIPKNDVKLRKALKSIRWGAQSRGKARFDRDALAWSCLADGLKGTQFAV